MLMTMDAGHLGGSSQDLKVVRITPIYKPFKPFGRGTLPYLGDLLTIVINHLLNGMILQHGGDEMGDVSPKPFQTISGLPKPCFIVGR